MTSHNMYIIVYFDTTFTTFWNPLRDRSQMLTFIRFDLNFVFSPLFSMFICFLNFAPNFHDLMYIVDNAIFALNCQQTYQKNYLVILLST